MTSPEVDRINESLRDSYGIETVSGLPMWRVVWADDQLEKRKSKFSPKGIELIVPEVFEFPKYLHIKGKWILENLVLVPEFQRDELCGVTKSYECLFVFEHQLTGKMLPPRYDVCQFVIHNVEVAKGARFNSAKYTEDPEKARKELDAMQEYLWGDETAIVDHTQYGTGVFVPSNYGEQ